MADHTETKESQLCIVSLIGKSTLFEQQCNKSWKLNQLIQMPAFDEHAVSNSDPDLEYHYDRLNNTIYVHLRSFHDTYQLLHLMNDTQTPQLNFAQLWETKQSNFVKKCLICFLLSHIIIVRLVCQRSLRIHLVCFRLDFAFDTHIRSELFAFLSYHRATPKQDETSHC
jgi:hypothetical protein